MAASGLWVMVGEMFPVCLHAAAISVATAFNQTAEWAVTEMLRSLSQQNLSAG
ncbi:hypothetical protein [Streptomyces mirabilis]|uniref:Uncharacterized protein n=1 Tax=Streptomyces mirabilis TaxID=68239 RepID=A0ABU3V5A3_9ACTN|nr:hypothetical protein [Streptomyces mirabilis]MCX5355707.1 hypothetical protein [Streptomyces mirabilis]MDU9001350.1 hypothetical protein [Streptomyces mirabilis]